MSFSYEAPNVLLLKVMPLRFEFCVPKVGKPRLKVFEKLRQMSNFGPKMAWVFLLYLSSFFLQPIMAKEKIHHEMTQDELRSVFHVEDHADVPDYEVVGLDTWRGSDLPYRGLNLAAFGRKLELKLSPGHTILSPRAPLFEASTNSSGHLHYTRLPDDGGENIGDTYQDIEQQAAILLHRDKDGSVLMEGTIGHDLVVKSVPESVRRRLHPNLIRAASPKSDSKHGHFVFKRNFTQNEQLSDYAFMEPDDSPRKKRVRRSDRSKREAPYVIYPEILVIVDYDGYRLHGGDNVQLKRYFVSFWNGVDLRYKLLKGPKVRISIAGIIISRGRDATPYLERNRVGRDAIDSAAALTDMGKYLFRERRLPVYDIAVAITKLDMCRRQFPSDSCNRGTAGFAYVGGACVVNKRLEKVNSVAIIEDTGGFSGIIVAAHEVGHLLGAVHDGSPPPSYLGGPGAESCRWEEGFIMSDLRHTEKGFRWSPCSISSFHHFLNGDTATCLYNSPHEDESLPRVLPGKLLSLDAQCRRDRGTSACFKDERVCAQLFCFDAGSGYCVAYRPAAEGSPCGESQYCSNGRCVTENDNVIPDYSSGTASYLRRNDALGSATQSRPQYTTQNNTRRSHWSTTPMAREVTTAKAKTLPNYRTSSTTASVPRQADAINCVDAPEKPGAPTCYDLVSKYPDQYCGTVYFKKNCCAAQKYLCKN